VEEITGVVKAVPDPSRLPPVGALYQLTLLPADGDAARFTVPVPHLVPGTVLRICGLLTETVIVLEYPVPPPGFVHVAAILKSVGLLKPVAV
jgi:hypothetical protein